METTIPKAKPILHASYCDGKGPELRVCDDHLDDLNRHDGFNKAIEKIVHQYLGIQTGSDFKMHLSDKDHIHVTVIDSKGKTIGPEFKFARDAKDAWSDEKGNIIDSKTTQHATLIYETIMKRASDCKLHSSNHKKGEKSPKPNLDSTSSNLSSPSTPSITSGESDDEEALTKTPNQVPPLNPTVPSPIRSAITALAKKTSLTTDQTPTQALRAAPQKDEYIDDFSSTKSPPIVNKKKKGNSRGTTTSTTTLPRTQTDRNSEEDRLAYLPEGESDYPNNFLRSTEEIEPSCSSSSNNENSDDRLRTNNSNLKNSSPQEVQDHSSNDKKAIEPVKTNTSLWDSLTAGLEQNTTHDFKKTLNY